MGKDLCWMAGSVYKQANNTLDTALGMPREQQRSRRPPLCLLRQVCFVPSSIAEAYAGHLTYREPTRATGVYVGVSQLEYARISLESGGALNTYYATGAHLSVTSGEGSRADGQHGVV